jgi:hypothetical protein
VTGVVDDCSPDAKLLVEVEDELDDDVAVEVLAVALLEAPGTVFALIAAKTPTPTRALTAAPVVSRLRRRMAASRARTLACVVSSCSMVLVSAPPLNVKWELPVKRL